MPLSTYTELIAGVADFLNRGDLTATIPTFVALAESKFNRTLRTRDMAARVMTTANTQYTELPSDYREMKFAKLIIGSRDYALSFLDQRSMSKQQGCFQGQTGQPQYYSLIANSIELSRVPDGDYLLEMGYYASIPALSEDNATNWLLTKHPDLYLYGSLLQSAPYLKDDERLPVWQGLHTDILESIRLEEAGASYSGATPRSTGRVFS